MKKSKILNWMLLAALVFGLGMSVTSCKDDDDNKSEEQKAEEAHEKAVNFWNVVGQLVSVDDVTDDYQGKTFEPTYGMPDGTNEMTRIVNTNDMKTAAQRFANLVGAKGIDENTPSYTWSDPDVGTMTYTRGGTAANWATVDVDIKAIPHLQKIIYRAGSEGDNGSFEGRAYYRFGDVVSREVTVTFDQKKNNDQRGTITEYWICVRPAFGPEGKEDSHWVCVNTVSDKNYKYYKASTGTEYWLPMSLKTDKENMQNFAELLWAICRPQQWFDNVFNHHTDGKLWGFSGVPFFTDFKGANLKYHNKYFWLNVQDGWAEKQVVEKALNLPNLAYLMNNINSNGVHLLYNGYSWWFTTSWNCELWEAVYTNGTKDEELNMHHAVYNEGVEKNMKELKFDVRTMGQNTTNYNGFFNNDGMYRWVIRHATGKELAANKKFDVKQPINGVTEVYRYYTQNPDEASKETENDTPEIADNSISPKKVKVGHIIGANGKIYENYDDANAVTIPVSMVCYTQPITATNNITYHFMAIALQPAGIDGKFKWGTHMSSCSKRINIDNDYATLTTNYCGIQQTKAMANEGNELHPAAWQCANYVNATFVDAFEMESGYSGYKPSQWFLPSAGEWVLFLKGLGVWDLRDGSQILSAIKKVYTDAGINSSAAGIVPDFADGIWTCVESSDEQAYVLKIDAQNASRFERVGKNVEKQVFPFIYY